ncbi:hypothetical protein [Paenibacillus sp. MBLB4367]|uniref:hypothetical protein n=1 Tax=Paenibacillus sp. MBLB4367 TaxID=3384767 RepID=UPI003908075F
MKKISLFKDVIVPACFALYLYVLVKAILFKFGPIEVKFLAHQLLGNVRNPESMLSHIRLSSNSVQGNLKRRSKLVGARVIFVYQFLGEYSDLYSFRYFYSDAIRKQERIP